MDFFDSHDNPCPPRVIASTIVTADGLALRALRWPSPGPARGTILIANGRGEFIEKYFEIAGELLDRNFDVVAFDWRGQGLSTRELSNPRKGHIDDFSLYERDLQAVETHVLLPYCPKPWFGLGHSMGGAILLAHALGGSAMFERMVLSAPMLGLAGLKYPAAAGWLAAGLDMIGLGGAFVPGGGGTAYFTKPFDENVLTSDSVRYARIGAIAAQASQLTIGSPTVGWLNAAFRLMAEFDAEDFIRPATTPVLMLAAGDDRVVDTGKIERFGARLKAARTIVIPHCLHEILIERDVFRAQFWAAFDAFVPGSA